MRVGEIRAILRLMDSYIQSLSKNLFWDVDRETLDAEQHCRFIIQRVLERGTLEDWNQTRDHYSVLRIVAEAQALRSLEPMALAFIACVGQVPKESFRCFTLKQSMSQPSPF